MTTKFDRFTQKVQAEPGLRFTALMGLLSEPEGLHASFERQDGRKAPGVDRIRKEDYAEGLDARLTELSARLRRLGYQPKPVRRTYIPKRDGRYHPFGVPSWKRIEAVVRPLLPQARVVHDLYPKPQRITQAGSRMV